VTKIPKRDILKGFVINDQSINCSFDFIQVKEVLKRSPDQDDLSESITVCGNRLAYTISYLCLKHGVGKKRSVGKGGYEKYVTLLRPLYHSLVFFEITFL
jgi:hypothetical protein